MKKSTSIFIATIISAVMVFSGNAKAQHATQIIESLNNLKPTTSKTLNGFVYDCLLFAQGLGNLESKIQFIQNQLTQPGADFTALLREADNSLIEFKATLSNGQKVAAAIPDINKLKNELSILQYVRGVKNLAVAGKAIVKSVEFMVSGITSLVNLKGKFKTNSQPAKEDSLSTALKSSTN